MLPEGPRLVTAFMLDTLTLSVLDPKRTTNCGPSSSTSSAKIQTLRRNIQIMTITISKNAQTKPPKFGEVLRLSSKICQAITAAQSVSGISHLTKYIRRAEMRFIVKGCTAGGIRRKAGDAATLI